MSKFTPDHTSPAFVQVLNRVMFDTTLSMGARLTYAALVDHQRDGASCWPSQERLASMVGVSARTIRNYLKELIARGLVTVLKRGCWQRANEYRLNALVPPRTAPESQPRDMRNPVSRDYRQGASYQQYPNKNSYRYKPLARNEAGAKQMFRRMGL